MMRRSQPRRAGPDDGDALGRQGRRLAYPGSFLRPVRVKDGRDAPSYVGSETMQVANRERLVHVALPAALLA